MSGNKDHLYPHDHTSFQGFSPFNSQSSNDPLGAMDHYMMNFTDYLDGSADYALHSTAFSHPFQPSSENFCENGSNDHLSVKSEAAAASSSGGGSGRQTPASSNSSISSSSTEACGEEGSCKKDPQLEQVKGFERAAKTKKVTKVRKKGEKKERAPRFAFMTRSEVDHLEDGYRWRKYGQKAVKNSSFPRSYYRCTNQNCSVKKRVERSYQDPSVVITTYEGHHNHHSPTNLRDNAYMLASPPPMPIPLMLHHRQLQRPPTGHEEQLTSSMHYFSNYGLLQDVIPSFNVHRPSQP